MRIISGQAGGRLLESPEGIDTRPTSQRVREAVFNSLFSAGAIDGAVMADVFAGSGAMGLEAISRGAAHVTFVESSPVALLALRANIETLDFGDSATVVALDALRYLTTAPGFDVVILDPPYSFDEWPTLVETVAAKIVVIESNRSVDLGDRWASFKHARYAATVIQLARSVS